MFFLTLKGQFLCTVSSPMDALLTPPETGASTNFKCFPSSMTFADKTILVKATK